MEKVNRRLKRESRSWTRKVQQGKRDELEYMIKTLQMFECGSLQEAMSRGGRAPTTTKWVDRTKKSDDGQEWNRRRRGVEQIGREGEGRRRASSGTRRDPTGSYRRKQGNSNRVAGFAFFSGKSLSMQIGFFNTPGVEADTDDGTPEKLTSELGMSTKAAHSELDY